MPACMLSAVDPGFALATKPAIDEILADYEDLEREDLLAALAFAAQLSRVKRMEA